MYKLKEEETSKLLGMAKCLVVEKGFEPTMGARPLRRALRRPGSPCRRSLSREFRAGDIITVDADNAEMTFLMEEIFS